MSVAYAENERFRGLIMSLLEPPAHPRTEIEKERICSSLREHMRRVHELHDIITHEAQRRRELETQLRLTAAALRKTQDDLVALDAGAKRAQLLARHDGLTSLPNRFYFLERLQAAIVSSEQKRQGLALFYLDLDGFKQINDAHGHGVGDSVLGIVGARLSRLVRAEDMVGRLGGDEFACFVAGFPTRQCLQHFAQKVIDVVAAPERVNSLDLAVRVSIGIALYPEHGGDAESLLHNADSAMYHSKRARWGFSFFDDVEPTLV